MTGRSGVVPLLLVAALAVASSTMAGRPASSAAARQPAICFGQVATIVGEPGNEDLRGTEGPDVIATNGSLDVDARGGDDLVCVTGKPARYGYGAFVWLGPGADQLLGHPRARHRVR